MGATNWVEILYSRAIFHYPACCNYISLLSGGFTRRERSDYSGLFRTNWMW